MNEWMATIINDHLIYGNVHDATSGVDCDLTYPVTPRRLRIQVGTQFSQVMRWLVFHVHHFLRIITGQKRRRGLIKNGNKRKVIVSVIGLRFVLEEHVMLVTGYNTYGHYD